MSNIIGIKLQLFDPDKIRMLSHGEVKVPATLNFRSKKPEPNGLMCEMIFGPVKSYECRCGKYSNASQQLYIKGLRCDKCGVELIDSKSRRERIGHIDFAAPIINPLFYLNNSSILSKILQIKSGTIKEIVDFTEVIEKNPVVTITSSNLEEVPVGSVISEIEATVYSHYGEVEFKYQMTPDNQVSNLEYPTKRYVVTQTGENSPFRVGQIINYLHLKAGQLMDKDLKAMSGPYGIKCLLETTDIKENYNKLKEVARNSVSISDTDRKTLAMLKGIIDNGTNVQWLAMTALPVMPPALHPMGTTPDGKVAISDINDLYSRIIHRNNLLRTYIDSNAPQKLIDETIRLLQGTVNALMLNGKASGVKILGPHNQPLTSIVSMLDGKTGIFRYNLLGKRVDYSGRSVIINNPNLRLNECGLPRLMAIELFLPFIVHDLVENYNIESYKYAKDLVLRHDPIAFDSLEHIVQDKVVLLNRAPTLHRLGIQAFYIKLHDGKAIQLPPMSCSGFNADFDGDTMAVHLPLFPAAQLEAKTLMLPSTNVLSPASGKPIYSLSQDMVLGVYFLTTEHNLTHASGKIIYENSLKHVEQLYYTSQGDVKLHQKVKLRYKGKWIMTTVGRCIFNAHLNPKLGFINEELTKSNIEKILVKAYPILNEFEYANLLDYMKSTGYHWATKSGISFSLKEFPTVDTYKDLLNKAQNASNMLKDDYDMGLLSHDEYREQFASTWTSSVSEIANRIIGNLDKTSSIYSMVTSGARGSAGQVAQVAGIRGVVNNPLGEVIMHPIMSGFKSGLGYDEFFISTHGTRKGLVDKSMRTASSGYLTRRLVDANHDVYITEHDCHSTNGLIVEPLMSDGNVIIPLKKRIKNRYSAKDIYNPKDNTLIVKSGELISEKIADEIEEAGITKVIIRSPMTCRSEHGICAKCYGYDLSMNAPAVIGEPVGVIAGQSIGEPGTQLTMRTFHTGGVRTEGGDITQGLSRLEELVELRNPKPFSAIISPADGYITDIEYVKNDKIKDERYQKFILHIKSDNGTDCEVENTGKGDNLLENIMEGSHVVMGQALTKGVIDPKSLVALGRSDLAQKYMIDEIQKVFTSQGINVDNKHIEIIIRKVISDTSFIINYPGDTNLQIGNVYSEEFILNKVSHIRQSNYAYVTLIANIFKNETIASYSSLDTAVNGTLDIVGSNISTNLLYTLLQDKYQLDKITFLTGRVLYIGNSHKGIPYLLNEPTYERTEMSITEVSKSSNSLLASASFGWTKDSITNSAIMGKTDTLYGLKENVMLGLPIPVGTGMRGTDFLYDHIKERRLGIKENSKKV